MLLLLRYHHNFYFEQDDHDKEMGFMRIPPITNLNIITILLVGS